MLGGDGGEGGGGGEGEGEMNVEAPHADPSQTHSLLRGYLLIVLIP